MIEKAVDVLARTIWAPEIGEGFGQEAVGRCITKIGRHVIFKDVP